MISVWLLSQTTTLHDTDHGKSSNSGFIAGGMSFRALDTPVEPKDEKIHLYGTQWYSYH